MTGLEWRPAWNVARAHIGEPPTVGTLVAYDYRAWRVVELFERPPDLEDAARPFRVILRPAAVQSADRKHPDDLRLAGPRHAIWYVITDEHYPVCVQCGDLVPCRDREAERVSRAAGETLDRFTTPGGCAACGEFVSHRQRKITYTVNLELPGGPPVTFHLRDRCYGAAADYERRLIGEDPLQPRQLYCGGRVTNHRDLTYDCSEGIVCPGPSARHTGHTMCDRGCCDDLGGHARGCFPHPTATRREASR